MNQQIPRDSEVIINNYIEEDFNDFISVEKLRLLEKEAKSILICSNNQLHEGVKKEGEFLYCAECGATINEIKRIK